MARSPWFFSTEGTRLAAALLCSSLISPGIVKAAQDDRLAGLFDCNSQQPVYAWLWLSRDADTLTARIDITGRKKGQRVHNLQLSGSLDANGSFRLDSVPAAGQRKKAFELSMHGKLDADGGLLADSSGLEGCSRLIAAPLANTAPGTPASGLLQQMSLAGRRLQGVDIDDCLNYAKWLAGGTLLQGSKKQDRYNSRFADNAAMRQVLGRDIAHWQTEDVRKFRAFTGYCTQQTKKSGNPELAQLANRIAGLGGWGPDFLRQPLERNWRNYRYAEVQLQSAHFAQLSEQLAALERASLQTAGKGNKTSQTDNTDPCRQALPDNLDQVYACMMTAPGQYINAFQRGDCTYFRQLYRKQLLRRGLTLSQTEARLPDCALFARTVEENTARLPVWQACFGYKPQPESAHVERCLSAVMERYYARLNEPRGAGCNGLQAAYRKGVAATLPNGIDDTRDMADPDCKLVERIRTTWVAKITEKRERAQAERQRLAAEREARKQAALEASRKQLEEQRRLEEERAIQAREAYARQKAQQEEMLRQRRIAAEQQTQAAKERREAEIKARYYTDTPESLRSKHSDRERDLMNAQGVIQVPDRYAEPSAEEIRLARMREIVERDDSRMVDGHLIYARRFNWVKDMFGFEGHEGAEVRFSDATKLGCRPAATVGYLCRYRISKTHKYDDYMREGSARENNRAIDILFGAQEMLASTLISTEVEGKVLEDWFVLREDGWRSPMTQAQQVELEEQRRQRKEWLRDETRKAEKKQRQQEQEEMIMETWRPR